MSTATPIAAGAQLLPEIPFVEVGQRIGLETFRLQRAVAHNLLDAAAAGTPRFGLRLADKISRAWLARTGHPYLAEIDEVAAALGRPGGHFFNVHYEWGCTTGVKSSEDGRSARLLRVLDWATNGLGRHIVAARSRGPAGDYVSLTWPGFTGALQGMAPGRFSAALNQAPMDNPIGYLPVDWALNRFRVWRRPHLTPAHLLRRVFEQARDFAEARSLLHRDTAVSADHIHARRPGAGRRRRHRAQGGAGADLLRQRLRGQRLGAGRLARAAAR